MKLSSPQDTPILILKGFTNQFEDKLGQGGNGEEFINEVATMGTIHHVNVVRLVGFCADGFKRALIYEYLPNESLEKFIFSRAVKNYSLSWKKLQEIAIGIAKGIEYLHQGTKCSLYDNCKGTIGYIAPEVLSRNFGNVSYKSDVYSFGMLLLEMVGGRKNIDLLIRIEEEIDAKIAKKLAIVGLSCIQWYPVDRPSMKIVVQMLEGEGDKLTMPPNPFASTVPTKTNLSKHEELFNKSWQSFQN
ncbi:Rust resistance kinase Lr10 [Vitis vinifera]|uniref:Rust resistance kinase Lr10 n=1 Tax=Vitis vinifera TaxID=29760 RepID=A0A438HSN3_VITVI|nr:Rust resistance kinase Lr10 [Vitis vinifera]